MDMELDDNMLNILRGSLEYPCESPQEVRDVVQARYGDENTFVASEYQPNSNGCIDIGTWCKENGGVYRLVVYLTRK